MTYREFMQWVEDEKIDLETLEIYPDEYTNVLFVQFFIRIRKKIGTIIYRLMSAQASHRMDKNIRKRNALRN